MSSPQWAVVGIVSFGKYDTYRTFQSLIHDVYLYPAKKSILLPAVEFVPALLRRKSLKI